MFVLFVPNVATYAPSPDGDEIAGRGFLARVVLVLDDESCGASPPAQSDWEGKLACSWLDAVDIAW